MLYSFTFLRHGESLGNARGIIQGQADFPLSEVGIRQACDLATRWQADGILFDRIISSPLMRARQTAEIVSATLQVPIDFDPTWMERSFGRLEGLPFEQVAPLSPPMDLISTYPPVGGDGESLPTLFGRAHLALDGLLDRPPGRYLVVAHGMILNVALLAILGIEPQPGLFKARFSFGNTAYASLSYDPALDLWKIIGLDNPSHRLDRVE